MSPKFILFLHACLLLIACQGIEPDPALIELQTPKPVILDVDMAQEDMNAALLLLAHPNVDLRAITVAGTGEAHCRPGVSNALGLLATIGRLDLPVACGPQAPLEGSHTFPEAWRQNADRAYGVELPQGSDPAHVSAAELILTILNEAEDPVSIVATGPLTNIAAVLQADPTIAGRIDGITIMGGAIRTGGNVGPSGVGINNETAEWNIYIDPRAAAIVFQSGIPLTLIPLDATEDVPINARFSDALGDHRQTPAAQLVYELLSANQDLVGSPGFHFWDSLTAAVFTDPTLVEFEDMTLVVVQEQGPEIGRTLESPTGTPVRVAIEADRTRFEQFLITVLNWQK